MADVVFYHIADEEGDDDDAHHRIYEIEPVACRLAEMRCQKMGDGVDQEFQQLGCESAYHSHHEGEQDDEITFLDVLFAPLHYFSPPFRKSVMSLFIGQFELCLIV